MAAVLTRRRSRTHDLDSPSARSSERELAAAASNLILVAGAGCVAASAYIHLHLWQQGYRNIHIVGPLFLAQAICGFGIGAGIAATRSRLGALAGALFLLATIGGLVTSDEFGLFGFHDSFDAPYAGLSIWVEVAGAVVLAGGALLVHRVRRSRT